MEIHAALTRVQHLLAPPADDMTPSLAEFAAQIAQCRERLDELAAEIEAARSAQDKDPAQIARANQNEAKLGSWRETIRKIEQSGIESHSRRDRRTWAHCNEAILKLESQLRERPQIGTPPTMLSKMFAVRQVQSTIRSFVGQAAEIAAKGRTDDWKAEFSRIEEALKTVIAELHGIDDELPPDQGMAQVRRSLRRLTSIEEDIEKVKGGGLRAVV
jgi:chromosome segregation ATPase